MRSRERGQYLAMNLHDRDMIKIGKREGAQEKAVEAALTLVHDYNASPELAAEKMGAPLDKVLEALKAVVATA